MTPWETLVERYCPEGKRVCNCRQAYETLLPACACVAYLGNTPVEAWVCRYGCSANQLDARDIVASGVLGEEVSK